VLERPFPLRQPPPETRRRRLARRLAAPYRPFGWALQAVGRADQRALVALRTRGHSALGVRTAQGLGYFGEMGSGWAAIGLAGALARPERRGRFLAAAAAAAIAILANYSVKLTIGRQRPLIEDHPPLASAPSKLSFPSAHSTSSVAGAIALGRVAPEARPALYAMAAVVCLGRPYLGMHYPSDVAAGVVLGYALGKLYPLPADAASGPDVQR
jgi:undecaprenyl-diphosphatase